MYKIKIRNRLLIFFLVVTFLPITTLGVFANLIYTKIVESKVNQHTDQMINQIEVNIDNYIKSVENILMYISNSEDIKHFLNQSEEEIQSDDLKILENKIQRYLKVYTDINSEIFGILIVNNYDKYISNELNKKTRDVLTKEIWYMEAINESEKVHFFSKPIGRNLKSYKSYSSEDIISISKAIIDKDTNKPIGVVIADINLKKFDEIIKDNYIGEKGFFYILDNNNNIVYSPVNSIIYRINSNNFDSNKDSFVRSINNVYYK